MLYGCQFAGAFLIKSRSLGDVTVGPPWDSRCGARPAWARHRALLFTRGGGGLRGIAIQTEAWGDVYTVIAVAPELEWELYAPVTNTVSVPGDWSQELISRVT